MPCNAAPICGHRADGPHRSVRDRARATVCLALVRDRHSDNLAVLLLVLACAGIQGWQVVTTGPRFDYQAAPFQLWPTIVVLARRC